MRFLHTMIRVGELERSVRFYTEQLGMKLIRKNDYPGGRFTLAATTSRSGRRSSPTSGVSVGRPTLMALWADWRRRCAAPT